MKTSELTGAALDWAVGIANGWVTYPTDSIEQGQWFHTNPAIAPRGYQHNRVHVSTYTPSSDWAQGGPIVEREKIDIEWEPNGKPWCMARMFVNKRTYRQIAETPLIAAMRCYCCAKLGDIVDIPEELCQQPKT